MASVLFSNWHTGINLLFAEDVFRKLTVRVRNRSVLKFCVGFLSDESTTKFKTSRLLDLL